MEATASRKLNCQICGRAFLPQNGAIGDNVRPSLAEFIKSQRPNWDPQQFICFGDLGAFRKDYVKQALEDEIGELTSLDQEVIESLQQHELLTENIEKQFERKLTFGEHLSDKIAEFGGSWKFIITFGSVIVVWIVLNVLLLLNRGFDPYPFILLNLILSCLAALQAPVIMMSQNRAEARDRLRAENDYKVNLKAELEIRHLHEKIDHLLRKQYNRLFEIQQIQIELLEEISQRKRGSPREQPLRPPRTIRRPSPPPQLRQRRHHRSASRVRPPPVCRRRAPDYHRIRPPTAQSPGWRERYRSGSRTIGPYP